MDWITQNIAIGNFFDAQGAIERQEVDAVLCLRPDCCDEDSEQCNILCIPLTDGGGNTQKSVVDALDFIHEAVSNDEKILVHCHAGRSRSVCIVAAYLLRYGGHSEDSALELIRSKREIYLSDGIEEIFRLARL